MLSKNRLDLDKKLCSVIRVLSVFHQSSISESANADDIIPLHFHFNIFTFITAKTNVR